MDTNVTETLAQLRATISARPLVIRGAGSAGRATKRVLEHLGLQIKFFVDSDPAKQGSEIDQSTIKHHSALRCGEERHDRPFVVIDSMYSDEIAKQLTQLGFKEAEDFLRMETAVLKHSSSKAYVRDEFHALSADVFLISYPKAGRTWLRLILGKMLQDYLKIETTNPLELYQYSTYDPSIPVIVATHDDDPHRKDIGSLDRDKSRYDKRKVIFLMRDPRDVLVSNFFQRSKRELSFQGTIAEFIHEDKAGLLNIVEFYNIWAAYFQHRQNVLVIKYEDLFRNVLGEMTKILHFTGLSSNIPHHHLEEACQYASFGNMRNLELADAFRTERLRPGDATDPDSFKTRRGVAGGYIDYFSREEISYIDNCINTKLAPYFAEYRRHTPQQPATPT